MTALRRIIHRHHVLSALLILAALALRVLVPSGFMPTVTKDGVITIQICSGAQSTSATMTIAIPGLPRQHDDQQSPTKVEMPCAFAGLGMPAIAGADALLLAIAIAFVVALIMRTGASNPIVRPSYLRPPLRGPPTTA
ncbi:hypothetical protein M0208_00200 [Sphingomonas sp. SUN019]|uniref:hypothetical protein n=1 Tax=Sphingomonas sp. SUN019 TaxID=2937788 RepID=UPI002164A6EB|nr:hypothetical protein [Sphingomonas sp. SUN019]UVO49020.1 hypothetical protein M0208_00200 [Sphingomonas sp. SUN019]